MGIREILTAPRKPWQNPFVERVIGSIRRECLISAASCAPTSPTTTPRAHTNRSTTTVPSPESSIPRRVAASSPCLRSAGFIIATSAPPDHLDHDPTSHPSSGPAGCRRLCGDPWSRLRPPPPCGPSHLQQRQCGLRLRTVEPWSHRDTGADEVSNRGNLEGTPLSRLTRKECAARPGGRAVTAGRPTPPTSAPAAPRGASPSRHNRRSTS
jgi:hypothetical protein